MMHRVIGRPSALTIFGLCSLVFMIAMYTLEHRGRAFVAGFALGCALSSCYGFLSGAWPFGVVEAIWTLVAVRRWKARIKA
jgi:dolichyl-phosphate-mannose--protein O-mannosyl transferase